MQFAFVFFNAGAKCDVSFRHKFYEHQKLILHHFQRRQFHIRIWQHDRRAMRRHHVGCQRQRHTRARNGRHIRGLRMQHIEQKQPRSFKKRQVSILLSDYR